MRQAKRRWGHPTLPRDSLGTTRRKLGTAKALWQASRTYASLEPGDNAAVTNGTHTHRLQRKKLVEQWCLVGSRPSVCTVCRALQGGVDSVLRLGWSWQASGLAPMCHLLPPPESTAATSISTGIMRSHQMLSHYQLFCSGSLVIACCLLQKLHHTRKFRLSAPTGVLINVLIFHSIQICQILNNTLTYQYLAKFPY